MNILTKQEIYDIKEKKDLIDVSALKVMEKNTKYLSLFSNHYEKMFQLLGNDIEKHLEYINRVIQISIPKAKYLHYIKSNFSNLYDTYILDLENKNKRELVDEIEVDSSVIYTKGVSLYNKEDSLKKDIDAADELFKILALKKETMRDFKLRKIVRFMNTLSLTFILSSIIYLM